MLTVEITSSVPFKAYSSPLIEPEMVALPKGYGRGPSGVTTGVL